MSWLAAQTMHSPGWEPVSFGESRGARGLFALQPRLVALTLLLLPLNWLLGTALLWVYAVAAILALSWERLSLLEGAYGFLAAVLVFALVIAMANEGGVPADRILASIYNLTIIGGLVAFANFGPDTRIIGFGVYATEGALLVLLAGLLAAIHAGARRRWLLLTAIEVMIAVALVEMASRTTLLAYLISLGLMAALSARRVSTALLLLTPVLAAGALIAAIYGPRTPSRAPSRRQARLAPDPPASASNPIPSRSISCGRRTSSLASA